MDCKTSEQKINSKYMDASLIEAESFRIISEILNEEGVLLPSENEAVIKRCIHTTADFDYAKTLMFSENAVSVLMDLIRKGADVVTDTNMALTGINKKEFFQYGGEIHCFMADEEVAKEAKERHLTRAYVSMERAMRIAKPVIYVVGNAPTALISLMAQYDQSGYTPAFIIGVPVGFVNVVAAKELVINSDLNYIVNRGRKGGSNVAAAIMNAVLYRLREPDQ
ncbi:MAG: precorrin-8X methylmutase [Lachnospiraceae bacterium]|nr:precorrin-8X methylmutase [Lachnospiraceae bacterium]